MERRKERAGGDLSWPPPRLPLKKKRKKAGKGKGRKDAKREKEEKGISPPFAPSFLPLKKEIPPSLIRVLLSFLPSRCTPPRFSDMGHLRISPLLISLFPLPPLFPGFLIT